MRRRKVFALNLIALIAIAAFSASSPLEQNEAEEILKKVEEILHGKPSTSMIFTNNIRVALLMLIPVLGLILGSIAMYNTGLVFAAAGVSFGKQGVLLLLFSTLLPFFWLEFIAYASATTQSLFLLAGILKRRLRSELRKTLYVAILIAGLLFLGAWVEAALIALA